MYSTVFLLLYFLFQLLLFKARNNIKIPFKINFKVGQFTRKKIKLINEFKSKHRQQMTNPGCWFTVFTAADVHCDPHAVGKVQRESGGWECHTGPGDGLGR